MEARDSNAARSSGERRSKKPQASKPRSRDGISISAAVVKMSCIQGVEVYSGVLVEGTIGWREIMGTA
eukprot:scaffold216408_cov15-Tisochrysis_lutea.AAC.1